MASGNDIRLRGGLLFVLLGILPLPLVPAEPDPRDAERQHGLEFVKRATSE